MRNVFWLRPQIIGGRTGPNKENWDPKELAVGGIGTVLSVNDGALVYPEELEAAGIRHACVPLSDNAPPQPSDLEICMDALPRALEFVLNSRDSGKGVLVHCSAGKDRTGMFLSYYLCQTEGLPASKAVEEVKRVRPIAMTAEGWESFTVQVLETLNA